MRYLTILLICGLLLGTLPSTIAQGDNVRLAYIQNNVVTLADGQGMPIDFPGPEIPGWQSAKLFWSPDGERLYTATREGLYITGPTGGAATLLPGQFGLTVTIARHGGALYNIDSDTPQDNGDGTAAYPLRETNIANMEGGRGRLIGYIGNYDPSSVNANLSHAAAIYARDAGFLEGGRPRIWSTYGGSLLYSCCFPFEGLSLINMGGGASQVYASDFITSAAALNATASRLAAPTTNGTIRTIDLVSNGEREYTLDLPFQLGPIERMAWSLDDRWLYFTSRELPADPLAALPSVSYPADTRSALIMLWRLDLVTGTTAKMGEFGDAFGVSSMSATDDNLFLVIVERNDALVSALNTGALPPDIAFGDPALDAYNPRSVLWRVNLANDALFAVDENIWGVAVRPY